MSKKEGIEKYCINEQESGNSMCFEDVQSGESAEKRKGLYMAALKTPKLIT